MVCVSVCSNRHGILWKVLPKWIKPLLWRFSRVHACALALSSAPKRTARPSVRI